MESLKSIIEGLLDKDFDVKNKDIFWHGISGQMNPKKISSKQDAVKHDLEIGDIVFFDGEFYEITDFYKTGILVKGNGKKNLALNARKVLKIDPDTFK